MFSTEVWSLLFSMMVQDGPYAGVRIYTLIKYDLLTYSIIFFICKNMLVICLVFYRLIIICVTKCVDDDDDDEVEKGSVDFNRYDNNSVGMASKGRRRLLSGPNKVTPNAYLPHNVNPGLGSSSVGDSNV
jgi:hypothetical protein